MKVQSIADQHLAGHPFLQGALASLFARTAAMGLIADGTMASLDGAAIRRVISALQSQRLATDAAIRLAPLMGKSGDKLPQQVAAEMTRRVTALNDVLAEAPVPATEWTAMRKVMGDDALAALIDVSPASLRRYTGGERPTPQATALRLHWIAMVVADLAGSYNDFGIRRWFERPRHQLDDKSPRQLLGRHWSVDSAVAARIRTLSAALVGAQPLAA